MKNVLSKKNNYFNNTQVNKTIKLLNKTSLEESTIAEIDFCEKLIIGRLNTRYLVFESILELGSKLFV